MADSTKTMAITAEDEAAPKVAEEFADAVAKVDDPQPEPETQPEEQPEQPAEDPELKKWRDLSRKNEDAAKKYRSELAAANAKIKAMEDRAALAQTAAEVAAQTGVPASLLRGSTKEELEAHAKAIAAAYAKPAAPAVPNEGKFATRASASGVTETPEQAQIRALADRIARQIGAIE